MSVEEAGLCQECGKQVEQKKGSITQWMGLGDTCKCWLDWNNTTGNSPRRKEKQKGRKCKRCLKPVKSNQSMTQWLFKNAICQCPAEQSQSAASDYTQKALSGRRHRFRRDGDNKLIIAAIGIGVLALSSVCISQIFDSRIATDFSTLIQAEHSSVRRHRGTSRYVTLQKDNGTITKFPLPARPENWNCQEILTANILSIRNCALTDDDLFALSNCGHMGKISLVDCDGFSPRGLQALLTMKELTSLDLDCSEIDGSFLATLGAGRLKFLDLSRTHIANSSWKELLDNDFLCTLKIAGVEVSRTNLFELNSAKFYEIAPLIFSRSQSDSRENSP